MEAASFDESSDTISAFSIDGQTGKLALLDKVASNGGDPAHVAVDASGHWVFAVNYNGGNVSMIQKNADLSLGAAVMTFPTGMNAHEIVFDPSSHFAFVPNKGSDDVSELVFDAKAGTIAPNTPLPEPHS